MSVRSDYRRARKCRPDIEACEDRFLLSGAGTIRAAGAPFTANLRPAQIRKLQRSAPGAHPEKPNLVVLPFGANPNISSFFDSTSLTYASNRVMVGRRDYFAPFTTQDARNGFLKIGSFSSFQDHASLVANPNGAPGTPGILIGHHVYIGPTAKVLGPAVVGSLNTAAPPTRIGAGAIIDRATVEPGAVIGERASIGPNVTVPDTVRVLPGKSITTDAEASDPALGKVVAVTAADHAATASLLNNSMLLVRGYINLYQGDPATGVSTAEPANQTAVVDFGSLAPISGISPESTSSVVPFAPSAKFSPTFRHPDLPAAKLTLVKFPSRIVGRVVFDATYPAVARKLGAGNSIRADEAQPFTFAGPINTGQDVTINGPVGGTLDVGTGVRVGDRAVILATKGNQIGNGASIGGDAVVSGSSLGQGVNVGDGAVVINSTLAPGTVVAPGSIIINDKPAGRVER